MSTTLLVASAIQFIAFASFAYVARLLAVRAHPEGADRSAAQAFIAWWGGIGGLVGLRGVLDAWAALAVPPLGFVVAERYAEIVLIAFAAWGMTFYVLYLFSGVQWLRWPLGVYFTLACAFYAYATYQGHPTTVTVGDWAVGMDPATPSINLVYYLVGIPIMLGTLAFGSLAFRSIEPIRRYRVALVAASMLAWVLSGLAASVSGNPVWSLFAITGLGLATAGSVFLAYRPPLALRARLDPTAADVAPWKREREQRSHEFRDRVRMLV